MKVQDKRISTRLSALERQKIEQLIEKGQFKNISQILRAALSEFLDKNN